MPKKIYFHLLAIVLFTSSCSGDDIAPIVTINTPNNGVAVVAGETLFLNATVTDETLLGSITLKSDIGLDQIFTYLDSPTMHDLNVDININPNTPVGDYTLDVIARDAEGNIGEESVAITIE